MPTKEIERIIVKIRKRGISKISEFGVYAC
jgi:hypothetical protein